MKNKNLFIKCVLGTVIFFLVVVILTLAFKKWNLFDFDNHSFRNIVVDSVISSIIFFVFLYIYMRNRLSKSKKNK
jgi:hypothetical protein